MTPEPRPSNLISRTSAIDSLRRWFSAQSEADAISVADIFKMEGREDLPEKKNRRWLIVKLFYLKPYNLVTHIYTVGAPRKLLGIQLTPEGRQALQRTGLTNATVTGATLSEERRTSPTGVPVTSTSRRNYFSSRTTAIAKVRQWFSAQSAPPESDSVSVEDIFKLSGREDRSEKTNRQWLSDMLLHLKPYDLVQPIYDERDRRREFLGVQLTPEGKRALAETELAERELTEEKLTEARLPSATVTGATLSEEIRTSPTGVPMTPNSYRNYFISRSNAVNRLRRLFSVQPDADSLSVEDIFKIRGRENRTEKSNRAWLTATLVLLKPYGLVKPVYSLGTLKGKILRIQLTPEGKRALAETEPAETSATETTVAKTTVDDARPTETGSAETMPVEVKPAPIRQIESWSAPFHIRNQKITLNDLMDNVVELQRQNPDLKVIFEIRLKQHEKS